MSLSLDAAGPTAALPAVAGGRELAGDHQLLLYDDTERLGAAVAGFLAGTLSAGEHAGGSPPPTIAPASRWR